MSGQHHGHHSSKKKATLSCNQVLSARAARTHCEEERRSSVLLLVPSLGLDHDSFWLGLASRLELDAAIRHAKPNREQYGMSHVCSWTCLLPFILSCPHSLTQQYQHKRRKTRAPTFSHFSTSVRSYSHVLPELSNLLPVACDHASL